MFGKVRETPAGANDPVLSASPYGVAKVYGHLITVNYRESYGCTPSAASCSIMNRRRAGSSS